MRRTSIAVLLLLAGLVAIVVGLNAPAGAAPAPYAIRWDPPQHVSTTAGNGAFQPDLQAAPDGTLIAVFGQRVSGVLNPYYSERTLGANTWTTPAPVHTSATDARQVTVGIDSGGTAHAVWRTTSDILHAREGQWPTGANTVVATGELVLDPAIAISSDDTLHVVWAQGDNLHNIYHAYSTNNGSTWSISPSLADTAEHSSVPDVAIDQNGDLHVVWEERIFDPNQPGLFRYEIHYKKGAVSGTGVNWDAAPTILTSGLNNSRRPAIIATENDLHVGFARQISNEEQYAYYVRYTAGSGWGAPMDITHNTPVSVNTNTPFFVISTLAACNDTIHLYYHGSPEVNTEEQIWGADENNNWLPREEATSDANRSVNPALICTGGRLHMVFERVVQANANHQIYYVSGRANTVYLPVVRRN